MKHHVGESQARRHRNCQYNMEHSPTTNGRSSEVVELSLAPREVTTTLVLREDQTVRLCMYGSDDPAHWPGDVCDDDDTAKRCKWFKPKVSSEEAQSEFEGLLADDEWVYENHRDLAALQWALGDRIHRHGLSIWDRFWLWMASFSAKTPKPAPALPPFEEISDEELEEGVVDEELVGVWDDDAPPEDT